MVGLLPFEGNHFSSSHLSGEEAINLHAGIEYFYVELHIDAFPITVYSPLISVSCHSLMCTMLNPLTFNVLLMVVKHSKWFILLSIIFIHFIFLLFIMLLIVINPQATEFNGMKNKFLSVFFPCVYSQLTRQ